jgi:hypothetical protein
MTDNLTDGAATPSADPLPEISYSEAESRRAELYGNSPEAQAWRDRYFSGDVSCKAEMDQIVRGLTTAPPPPVNDREAVLAQLRQVAVISQDVAQEILDGRPATVAEHEGAKALWDQLIHDEEWIESFNKGNIRARQQKAYIDLILSKPVRG